jgi:hypothetical protein
MPSNYDAEVDAASAPDVTSPARVQAFRDFLVAKAQRWTY